MMRTLSTFVFGMIVGAGLLFAGLRYHVVRAQDGFHLIPKSSARLTEPYIDIRKFSVADWDAHRALAMAIVQADKAYLMEDSAAESIRRSFNDLLGGLNRPDRR
jgi:hypothetical protein